LLRILVTMRALLIGGALIGALQLVLPAAYGQDSNNLRPLLDRLDRMERDMNQLQRQVYRGGSTSGAPVPNAPAEGGTAVTTEIRLDQLDAQMRQLTGTLEEITYNMDQLKRRLDKLVSDVDQRLTALEHPGAAADAGPAAAAANPPRAASAGPATGAGADPSQPPSQPGFLQAPAQAATQAPAAPAPGQDGGAQVAAKSPSAGTLPSGSAQDQYNYAFGLLRQADYPAAEAALRAFVQRYPNDPLAGNAQYWLGETFYVRKDYNNAAATFAEGYRKYPQSGKGADNLLKLGMSLGNVGQKKEACLTFNQLNHDFPQASANIKERATQERQRLGC
jgi:tol-pal system protein YbgF